AGDVQHQLVHTDPADALGVLSPDDGPQLSAAEAAGDAVGVADGDGGHLGGPLRPEDPAVAHRLPGSDLPHRGDPGLQGHDRHGLQVLPQVVRRAALDAKHQNAQAGVVIGVLRVVHRRIAAQKVNRPQLHAPGLEGLHHAFEGLRLPAGKVHMFLLVRVRHAEVGVDAGDLQDAVLIHPPDGVQVLRQESDAVHTR
ncbi:acyltransferase, partial [Dysosmobacter welbionis]